MPALKKSDVTGGDKVFKRHWDARESQKAFACPLAREAGNHIWPWGEQKKKKEQEWNSSDPDLKKKRRGKKKTEPTRKRGRAEYCLSPSQKKKKKTQKVREKGKKKGRAENKSRLCHTENVAERWGKNAGE